MRCFVSVVIFSIFITTFSYAQTIPPGQYSNELIKEPQQEISAASPVVGDEFTVFMNDASGNNHFIPAGWMGDVGDIKANGKYTENCHTGTHCLQYVYTAQKSNGQGWAGVYWQNPANNWGDKKGAYNLQGMKKLTFWARGEEGKEKIQKFMVGGIKGKYPDSTRVQMGPVELTNEWKQYTLDLTGQDLSSINGAFAWTTTAELNPQGCTFYLEDIKFEK